MKTRTQSWKWLGAILAMVGLTAQARAAATNPAYLNIDVTITSAKSVTVNGVGSSTATTFAWAGTPNQLVTVASTATVQNNSGILSEGWELSTNANSIDTTGGGQTWALAASTSAVGGDQFGLQAVFGSSSTVAAGCPLAAAAEWNSTTIAPPLTAAVAQYTAARFADSNLNAGGGVSYEPDNTVSNLMFAFNAATGAGSRALCWRAIMPASTSTQNTQNIQVIVTAL